MAARERRVLIVDDSPEDRETVRRYLTKRTDFHYTFSEQTSGLSGLEECRRVRPDCLVLDYDLPDLNGLDFLADLMSGYQFAPFPIVMLTGRGEETVAVHALKTGAHDYLVKGHFTPAILHQTVEDAIEKVANRKALDLQRAELERLYGETREADHRKDEFLATLAHELRNPLSTILNAVHILKIIGDDKPGVERMRDMIERQVSHLCRLVDDLLDVSRITRGKIHLRKEVMDFSVVASMTVDTMRSVFEHRRQSFHVTLPDGPIWMDADPTRIEQIIVNLLNNASKYTDSGGSISMKVERHAHAVVLSVRDNGIGIAPEMLELVFNLFSQAERALDRSQGGLGIGLTLVRNLVDMHGGEVSVQSEGEGKGSEFTIRLPTRESVEPQIDFDAPTSFSSSNQDIARILVVDDNIHAAESLALVVQTWNHQTSVAHNGADAIEQFHRFQPQVILLDIGLPGRDGYSVAQEIRNHPAGRDLLLIAMTGYGREEDFQRSREAGFDSHLVKPLDFDQLEAILADVKAARESLRAT